jgi:drug/metabolite transporter (DMT)-like permease|tara:strand:- start:103 stop:1017 length:915 start_codon:yes stop_codon:yes gene_type:complete
MSSHNLEKPSQPSLIQTFSAIIVAAIGWGSGNVISRSLLIEGIDEIYLITIRVVVIGTILIIYYSLFIREKFEIIIFKEASLTSIFSLFAVSWFFIFALQYISSGLVTLLISSAPVFTVIWLKILLKEENISKTRYLAIFIGLIGVSYLFLTKETGLLNQGDILVGGTLAFMGVQCIALATVLNRKFAPKYKVFTWLTYQYPTVMFLTISAFFIFDIQIESLSTSQVTRIIFLILANLSAFTSFTWLIRRVSALQVASVDYLVPIIGVSAGVIFLNESFNFNIVVAGVFIFISLILNTKEEFST